MNGRSTRPAGDSRVEAKRRAILAAAGQAFRTLGFQRTGMREIARAAGLTTPNLYYYFESKDELLYFCQRDALERMLRACRQIERTPAAPAEKLRAAIGAQLTAMLDAVDGATAHLELDSLPAELRQPIVKRRDQYERLLRSIVSEGIQAGQFVDCDPTLITRALLGALNWTARWYRPGGPTQLPELIRAFADYLVRGLLVEQPPQGRDEQGVHRSQGQRRRNRRPFRTAQDVARGAP